MQNGCSADDCVRACVRVCMPAYETAMVIVSKACRACEVQLAVGSSQIGRVLILIPPLSCSCPFPFLFSAYLSPSYPTALQSLPCRFPLLTRPLSPSHQAAFPFSPDPFPLLPRPFSVVFPLLQPQTPSLITTPCPALLSPFQPANPPLASDLSQNTAII